MCTATEEARLHKREQVDVHETKVYERYMKWNEATLFGDIDGGQYTANKSKEGDGSPVGM